jgi:hypothetical protein
MSCCFGPSLAQPSASSQDPTKHVNYVLGMVLGVDDLNQEFAYHSQRDQWIVRDLLGYGTVWGLRVSTRDRPTGPEVVVAPGVAVNPRGQLIRVAPTQCASLNEWMAARTDDILEHRVPTLSPNLFNLPLYLVLSYRECLTDPVPIAGEPCRSESNSTQPSRAADDFLLELTFAPPAQQEEDAVREFVQWLRTHITVISGGGASLTVKEFLDTIRAAADAAAALPPEASPPPGPDIVLLDTSPMAPLAVPAGELADYLRAALRLWVTELRPRWRPNWMGDKHGCAGDDVLAAPDQGNQVLLAALTVPIVPPGLNQSGWTVTHAADVLISEETRPFVLSLRLLQEGLITQDALAMGLRDTFGPVAEPLVSRAPIGPSVVAAGVINGNGTPTARSVVGGLHVETSTNTPTATELRLSFAGYSSPPAVGGPQYLVKALPWPSTALRNLTVTFMGFQVNGFLLQISKNNAPLVAAELKGLQLMVEVSQYP